jgi:hypothetical protein
MRSCENSIVIVAIQNIDVEKLGEIRHLTRETDG